MKITIDTIRCKGCNICISICPKKVYARSKNRNNYGSPMPEALMENACTGCRLCEKMCPDAAINIEE